MLLAPIVLIPLITGLANLLSRSRRVMVVLNMLACVAELALAIRLFRQVLALGAVFEWDEFLYADALSAWMALLISIVALATSLYSGRYFARSLAEGTVSAGRVREYFVLTPLFTGGMFFAVLANNLGMMWFALEAMAMSAVLLIALYNRKTSLEAAWKYIVLGSLGLALALFATVFTYAAAAAATPSASEKIPSLNWSHLMNMAPQLNRQLVKLAFVFAFVGYGTKAGLAPMHTWLPDAHSEAPAPMSAMLSGVSLKIAIYALLRFHILTTHCLDSGFSRTLLLSFGLFSMFLAAPFILVQRDLKRMLAYSSLEHVGLICTAVGMNSPVTIFGALLHMGYHALTKPVLFFAAGNIHQTYHTTQLRLIGTGVFKVLPVTGLCMALAAAAVTGLPPFGLFYSELMIISGGFAAKKILISVLVLLAIVAAFCGILKQLTRILPGNPKHKPAGEAPRWDGAPAMGLLLGGLFVFSAWMPGSIFQLLERATAVIGGRP